MRTNSAGLFRAVRVEQFHYPPVIFWSVNQCHFNLFNYVQIPRIRGCAAQIGSCWASRPLQPVGRARQRGGSDVAKMVTTAFFAPLIGAWKGAAAVKIVKTAMVTAAAGHLLPHGESVEVDHGQMQSHADHTDHLEHSHADPADHGDHGHDEHHEEHHEDHEEHEHDDHEHEHEDHEHEEEGDEMEETVEAAEFAKENGAVSGGPQFWRSFQKRSQSHPKPSPESASATNAEAVLKAVAAAAAVASVTSRMVESRCQELRCRPKQRNDAGAAGAAARVGAERRKPWRSCGDPFPNPSGQLSMVI